MGHDMGNDLGSGSYTGGVSFSLLRPLSSSSSSPVKNSNNKGSQGFHASLEISMRETAKATAVQGKVYPYTHFKDGIDVIVARKAAKKALSKQQQQQHGAQGYSDNNNRGDKRPLPQLPQHSRSHSAGQGQGLGQGPGQGLVVGSSMERSDYDSGVMDDDWYQDPSL